MENEPIKERVLDMGNGIAIWKVDIDLLREQDKNARVMSPDKLDRMKITIADGKRLESLPLCVIKKNASDNEEFHIISGHHRTRAARAAGLREVFVMVIEEELSRDQIRAKQLAHNALTGYDDPIMLAELFNEIQSIESKLESGIFDGELDFDLPAIRADDIVFDFDYEMLQILFLPKQKEKFDEVLKLLEKDAEVYLADKADFEHLREVLATVSERENIRNVSALFAKMLDIVEQHYKNSN
ncbi:MAG TPA: ParB/RepB/Spo0J family partition protein [Candidatus Paceibacterota bacterium]|nr:ParB/RepB/Spo0J family partition protein [Candidatus Paceibacterota bacterium]